MVGRLLLLREQCEPFDEFLELVKQTQYELQDPRTSEYLGRGHLVEDIVEHHGYMLEELLYPLIDKCNPVELFVVVDDYHIEVAMR